MQGQGDAGRAGRLEGVGEVLLKLTGLRVGSRTARRPSPGRRRSCPRPSTRLAQDHRPLALGRDHVQAVVAGGQRLAADRERRREGHDGVLVGAGAPHLVVGHQIAPDRPLTHGGPVVPDGDVGQPDALRRPWPPGWLRAGPAAAPARGRRPAARAGQVRRTRRVGRSSQSSCAIDRAPRASSALARRTSRDLKGAHSVRPPGITARPRCFLPSAASCALSCRPRGRGMARRAPAARSKETADASCAARVGDDGWTGDRGPGRRCRRASGWAASRRPTARSS